jgi:hypothetical protein
MSYFVSLEFSEIYFPFAAAHPSEYQTLEGENLFLKKLFSPSAALVLLAVV